MTQEELAAQTRLSVRTIQELESGRGRVPRPASVRLLADAFGLQGTDREAFHQRAGGPEAPAPCEPVDLPRQVPADTCGFTGRGDELDRLDEIVCAGNGGQVPIALVCGTAGVGKTALAIHWAHRARARFPDGQLYADLRGFDPRQPMQPADTLAGFLSALGVPGQQLPVGIDDRAALFRTRTAGRRMLLVLDNAGDPEQVRPLLPGQPACAVLVTSRDRLAGLVARDGAQRLDLDLLPVHESMRLLGRLIGVRAGAEPDATETLAERCVRLPLAMRVAAELVVSRPATAIAQLAEELGDVHRRLDLLDAGADPRTAVASVFSWSVRHLPADAAVMFGLVGLHPGVDYDVHAAAALAGTDVESAGRALRRLVQAMLVHEVAGGRYGMHDLLRAYAERLATEHGAGDEPHAALSRLFDYYANAAARAMDGLYPAESHHRPRVACPGTPVPRWSSAAECRAWLDAERSTLVAIAGYAATNGWAAHATTLAATLFRYLDAGHYADALVLHGHAWAAAEHTGDLAAKALVLNQLGAAHAQVGRYTLAADQLGKAVGLLRQLGDVVGEARARGNLGATQARLGHHRQGARQVGLALELYRRAGDRTGEARALSSLGIIEMRLGRYAEAAGRHRQALAMHRAAGDRSGEAYALNNCGDVATRLRRYTAADQFQRAALALFGELGHRSGEAWTLDSLGTLHARTGRPDLARDDHERALALFRQLGERDGEAYALNGLGECVRLAGRPIESLVHHLAALEAADEAGVRDQQARARTGIGDAFRALDDQCGARTAYERAVDLYHQLGMPEAGDVQARLASSDLARLSC